MGSEISFRRCTPIRIRRYGVTLAKRVENTSQLPIFIARCLTINNRSLIRKLMMNLSEERCFDSQPRAARCNPRWLHFISRHLCSAWRKRKRNKKIISCFPLSSQTSTNKFGLNRIRYLTVTCTLITENNESEMSCTKPFQFQSRSINSPNPLPATSTSIECPRAGFLGPVVQIKG